MHDSTIKPRRPSWLKGSLLLLSLLLSLASQQAFALIENNLNYTDRYNRAYRTGGFFALYRFLCAYDR